MTIRLLRHVLSLLLGATALGLEAHAQTTVSNTTYSSGQNVTVLGPSTVTTSGAVTVSGGANVRFLATSGITLNAGFSCSGSTFQAAIISLTVTPSAPGGLTFGSSSTVALSFAANATNDTIAKMEIYRKGVLISTLTSPTSGSTWTFTESSLLPLGTYTYQARVYDGFGAIITNSTPVTVTVLPILPYLTDFESSDGYTLASLDQQLGWSVSQGSAVVTNQDAAHGTQSALLQPGTPPTQITQVFAPFVPPTGSPNIIFVDFFAKPVAVADVTTATTFNVGSTRFAFVLSGAGQGTLEAFNGNGSGGGAWTSTNFTAPLVANNQSQNWIRLTARLDFTQGTWDLYANGTMAAASLGFLDSTSTTLTSFSVQGVAATTSEVDDLLAGPQNPLFVDVNNDGIDDAWETAHGLSLSVNDRNLDPINKGETVLQDYIYGADPNKIDTNGNGLADTWQIKYFKHLGVDPNADTDGDGLSNIREYFLGTDPTVDDRTPTTVLRLLLPGGGYQKVDVATLNLTL